MGKKIFIGPVVRSGENGEEVAGNEDLAGGACAGGPLEMPTEKDEMGVAESRRGTELDR